jgi:hypothetical protein
VHTHYLSTYILPNFIPYVFNTQHTLNSSKEAIKLMTEEQPQPKVELEKKKKVRFMRDPVVMIDE